ncbi:DUF6286 domain-containing Asp23/Gls24 family envelope stress response protein [Streptomyces sp. NPDC006289]|uniref:DUF6286 domain-containing Asp23/Gls24 family envelope stress response protein n=1 Tax=Streptomyces sp. NPDC006289 TaxID=3156744 RepID=UPI0033A24E4E
MTTPSQRGTTTVSDKAVRKIAGRAAAETLPGRSVSATRVSAVVSGRRANVSLGVALPYPAPVAETVRRVQEHVTTRTRQLTGLDVSGTKVSARTLNSNTSVPPATPSDGKPVRRASRRWWSARRVPMAVLTAAGASACGALAFDVIRVHLAHRPPAAWRSGVLDWLSTHGPGDTPVVLGGAAAALLGLSLIVLAVTPGRRRLLTLSPAGDGPGCAVDRSAVGALVRDAVADVPGIGHVSVRVGRRRVAVRAGLAFGDRAAAREQVVSAAGSAVAGCALRNAPRVRVRVKTEPAWQAPAAGSADAPQAGPGTPDPALTGGEK